MSHLNLNELSPESLVIHGAPSIDPGHRALVPSIVQSTSFRQSRVGEDCEHTYSRDSNPTVAALEGAMSALEGLPYATAYSTGMAAITSLFLATLNAGDHLICSEVVYGGTARLLREVLSRFGVEADFIDTTQTSKLRTALRPKTKLIFVESPANPTMVLTDLRALSELAKQAGALLAVDNTFLTPLLQNPAALGADISVYSTTKAIEGHNATVGGALLLRDQKLHRRLLEIRKSTGCIQSPFEAWLTIKGLKTLPLRLRRQSESALHIARYLEEHPRVERVHYPFLESFPQYSLAKRQQAQGGGLLSFELIGGALAGAATLKKLKLCALAENLGAAETLVTHPATMTHADVPEAQRKRAGINDGLIRLSVGLEDPKDIFADLDQALATGEKEAEA